MKLRLSLLLAALTLVHGCAAPDEEPVPDAIETSTMSGTAVARSGGGTVALPIDDPAAMEELQGRGVRPAPTIRLTAPAPGAVIEDGSLAVSYQITDFQVGEEGGQHVHVILDDRSYEADYSADGSIVFSGDQLTPGTHRLTVFLARAMHLSLKNPEASDHLVFHVMQEAPEPAVDPAAPTLVYSRPTGEYSRADGSAANILLDFYLLNATLGPESYSVRATIDGGASLLIDDWQPRIVLTDPSPGEHTVRLELLDAEGNPVPGPLNDTTRTITITE